MIKKIVLFSLLGVFNINILQAQQTEKEIQVNLDDFDVENMTQSERILLNLLVKREVKNLEKQIEQLSTDKKFGKISPSEYENQKKIASDKIADKIGRSIDILTDSEIYMDSPYQFEDSVKIDNVNFKFKKDDNKRTISFQIGNTNDIDSTCVKDKKPAKVRESVHFGFGFANWMNEDNERYDDPSKKLSGNSSWYYEFGIKANTYLDKKRLRTSVDYGITLISRYYQFNDTRYSVNFNDNGVHNIEDAQITESVFSQTAFEFPLSITHRFTNSSKERLAISAGLYGGINLRSRQKIKYSVADEDYKAKWISDFNSNRFYGGAKVALGYNSFYLTARYNFSKLFKSSSEINVNPYTIGISFGL